MKTKLVEALHYADVYNSLDKETANKMWGSWTDEQRADVGNQIRKNYTNEQIGSHLLGAMLTDEYWESFEHFREISYDLMKNNGDINLCSHLESTINMTDRLLLTTHVTNRFDEGDYMLVEQFIEEPDNFKVLLLLILNDFRKVNKYQRLVKNMNNFMS